MRILCLLAAPLVSCVASFPDIDAGARYVNFEPDGDLQLTSGTSNTGNTVNDLGLNGSDGTVGAFASLKFGVPHFSVSSQSSSWQGSGVLSSQISLDGVTLDADTPVNSELDLGLHSALLTWDLIPGSTELGIGFGVAGIELAGSFEGVVPIVGVQRVEFDEIVPVPLLAVRAGIDLGFMELGGTLAGLAVDIDDDEATIFDLDVSGRFCVLGSRRAGGAFVTLGWRQLEIDVDVTDDGDGDLIDTSLSFYGPFAGLQLSF